MPDSNLGIIIYSVTYLSIISGNRWFQENYTICITKSVLLYGIIHLFHLSSFLESQCLFLAWLKITEEHSVAVLRVIFFPSF